jgi:hypothetical protein
MSTDMTIDKLVRDRLVPDPVLERAQLSDTHEVNDTDESAILHEGEKELPPY